MTPDNDGGPTRLVIVDDHHEVRQYLSDALSSQPDLTVVGEAGTVEEAKTVCAALEPDVLVLDWNLPDGSGLDLCRHLAATTLATRCIVHSGAITEVDATAATQAGAAAIVMKSLSGTELVDAIRRHRPKSLEDAERDTGRDQRSSFG